MLHRPYQGAEHAKASQFSNVHKDPKTSEKNPPKIQNSEGGDVFCSIWIYWCFLGPLFGGVGLGRQEKVKFCIIFCPVWLFVPQCPRIMVMPHVEMERDQQQESACGFCHYWCGFYHYWDFFSFEFSNINGQGPQSCK